MIDETFSSSALKIGILGTGHVAQGLGARWAAHDHQIVVGGRSLPNARSAATDIGHGAKAGSLVDALQDADVVLLALPWSSVHDVLEHIKAGAGALAGVTVIDPINPVAHGIGQHLLTTGSASEDIATRAPGTHVVKAFNLHPASAWESVGPDDVVTIAGDNETSLGVVQQLIHEMGATPHTLGGLDRARQLEELAGTVIALAFGGINPRFAVPQL